MTPIAPASTTPPRLTSLAHGGGCGCKIAPGVLSQILKQTSGFPMTKELLVGIETADDAAVYQLNSEQCADRDHRLHHAHRRRSARLRPHRRHQRDQRRLREMGGTPIFALALVGMPV